MATKISRTLDTGLDPHYSYVDTVREKSAWDPLCVRQVVVRSSDICDQTSRRIERLRRKIRKDLRHEGCPPFGPDDRRLGIYSVAFDQFIEELLVRKDLFTEIKDAYDAFILAYRAEQTEANALLTRIHNLEAENLNEIAILHEQRRAAEIERKIQTLTEDQERLNMLLTYARSRRKKARAQGTLQTPTDAEEAQRWPAGTPMLRRRSSIGGFSVTSAQGVPPTPAPGGAPPPASMKRRMTLINNLVQPPQAAAGQAPPPSSMLIPTHRRSRAMSIMSGDSESGESESGHASRSDAARSPAPESEADSDNDEDEDVLFIPELNLLRKERPATYEDEIRLLKEEIGKLKAFIANKERVLATLMPPPPTPQGLLDEYYARQKVFDDHVAVWDAAERDRSAVARQMQALNKRITDGNLRMLAARKEIRGIIDRGVRALMERTVESPVQDQRATKSHRRKKHRLTKRSSVKKEHARPRESHSEEPEQPKPEKSPVHRTPSGHAELESSGSDEEHPPAQPPQPPSPSKERIGVGLVQRRQGADALAGAAFAALSMSHSSARRAVPVEGSGRASPATPLARVLERTDSYSREGSGNKKLRFREGPDKGW